MILIVTRVTSTPFILSPGVFNCDNILRFYFKNRKMQRGWRTLYLVYVVLFSGLTWSLSIRSTGSPPVNQDVAKWRNETSKCALPVRFCVYLYCVGLTVCRAWWSPELLKSSNIQTDTCVHTKIDFTKTRRNIHGRVALNGKSYRTECTCAPSNIQTKMSCRVQGVRHYFVAFETLFCRLGNTVPKNHTIRFLDPAALHDIR